MSKNVKLIALPEAAAFTGSVVYWRLKGSVDWDELEQSWEEKDLEQGILPRIPTPEKALKRAFISVSDKDRFVRSLDPKVGGYALVNEKKSGRKLEHGVELTAVITVGEADEVQYMELSFEPSDHPLTEEIHNLWETKMSSLEAPDVSAWLAGPIMQLVRGVPLRDGGGVYFIPRGHVPIWKDIVQAVSESSDHIFFEIPAASTGGAAAAAILDALTQDVCKAAAKMEVDKEKELGKRALKTRIERCSRLIQKVSEYGNLIGDKLENLHEKIGTLQASFSAAILAATGDES